ncbi:MAG: hypothetical protein A2268_02030 [Candidatus Raymondbacteria bacterium RifOxyA12_full_50_37]|uniref:Response regulatory domain-containing protein n=1 Tax=Candidatus Raymondbacteria bacterium RIFOXYD12_FULL_49_13 TaxID=1817890 RepID=A0A1F7F4L7_UNCRA|nr:MAG: hypothetical protein A2268_02030 [Candidatus Raymondbacteria bacterium RifOxyA12_full_50_37]OGJ91311.1 MAG: hypothetical protein A2350_13305 [Candidatus Raymondbacteria bacterium RifOxyB12_full_50_8]OGJ92207.1 MAG: hypothetical protein A2248_10860 [Candidatus Raymondbacteria bacterium RIFOXYA2_FULL_49_16]OGJ98533.1 MAG: hypothetical protein A2453_06660 [Candidatus Raymondbacteria bacterium RIFOXYC2_FULL_50_21]OGK01605.1 MAG: hypothetical protein A2519_06070 [Candidatus Raymondbacteria b
MSSSRICFSQKSDKYGNFPSVLFVDDTEDEVNRFAEMVCLQHKLKNVACVVCNQPKEAFQIALKYFIDIYICDIKMPHIAGDTFIKEFREHSPMSYFIAITGHSMETAARAGACADIVVLKDFGYLDKLMDVIKEGLRIVQARKIKAGGEYYKPQINEFDMTGIHWRDRERINEALGKFNPQDHNRACRAFKALALGQLDADMTHDEIATHAGFGSPHYMMKAITPMFNWSESSRLKP